MVNRQPHKDVVKNLKDKRVFLFSKIKKCIPIILISNNEKQFFSDFKLSKFQKTFLDHINFMGKENEVAFLPGETGRIAAVLVGKNKDIRETGSIINRFPRNNYFILSNLTKQEHWDLIYGFLMGQYSFDRYLKKDQRSKNSNEYRANLYIQNTSDISMMVELVNANFLVRDLINTPASDLGPDKLESVINSISYNLNANIRVVKGDRLLHDGFPLIHAVGRASNSEPRLIELVWGNKNSPTIAIIGKGVCFDTGGLNLKPSNSMGLMKKDMGGAGVAIGLASYIMRRKLDLQIKLIIPAVENSLASNAFRPGDILTSRKGKTIEVNNTDAEGRLILADALTYADEGNPDLILCLATLTGAARVALGTELVPFYCNNEKLCREIKFFSEKFKDPVWRMPFYEPYKSQICSNIADLDNAPSGGMAGSITAALFLKEFVDNPINFAHFDLYAWNKEPTKVNPVGGKAQILSALVGLLESISERTITLNKSDVSINNKMGQPD